MAASAQDHIIRRPRLIDLLDEADRSLTLLVAPAGYGKTTLARQWAAESSSPVAWYTATEASADVAALALGLSQAASSLVPDAGEQVRAHLRTSASPEQDIEQIAALVAADLSQLSDGSTLVIDDYQFLLASPAAERLVETMAEKLDLRLVLASRLRPRWITARRIVYGEVLEIDRVLLAMSADEAHEVLASRPNRPADKIFAEAHGWPAVIGLAALSEGHSSTKPDPELSLYEYFATELYEKTDERMCLAICTLALSPDGSHEVARELLGESSPGILAAAERLGFLELSVADDFQFHPLLRDFLCSRLKADVSEAPSIIKRVACLLIERRSWDAAFEVIQEAVDLSLLDELLSAALLELLSQGRLATLERWVVFATTHNHNSGLLDLSEAAIGRRTGSFRRARALALEAASRLRADHLLLPYAYRLAGECAHLAYEVELAVTDYARALELARTEEDVRSALWGQLLEARMLESDDLLQIFAALRERPNPTAEDKLRLANATLILPQVFGDLRVALEVGAEATHLLPKTHDPLIKTGFLNQYSYSLALNGRYREAFKFTEIEIAEAAGHGLDFVMRHAVWLQALAHLGLRQFSKASMKLDVAERMARETRDDYQLVNCAALRSRLYLSQMLPERASEVGFDDEVRVLAPAIEGEYKASIALALATLGDIARAEQLCDEATALTRTLETRCLAVCARAIMALQTSAADTGARLDSCFREVVSAGDFDALVCAYRGYPDLLVGLARGDNAKRELARVIEGANDWDVGRIAGVVRQKRQRGGPGDLSKREHEVWELLSQGMTNKEIARALFITEATVKLHVRHILSKFGVRTRTEAALVGRDR